MKDEQITIEIPESHLKVQFIDSDSIIYALLKHKTYIPIYESEENYLIKNELEGNSIVPKNKFIVCE